MKVSVRVKPFSGQPRVETGEDGLTVWVDAPAAEGKANKRLREILAGHYGVSAGRVRIVRGETSRRKIVEVT